MSKWLTKWPQVIEEYDSDNIPKSQLKALKMLLPNYIAGKLPKGYTTMLMCTNRLGRTKWKHSVTSKSRISEKL